MEKILFVNACVRPESRTSILAQHVLSKLNGSVEEINLGSEEMTSLNLQSLNKRHKFESAKDFSDDMFRYAKQFIEADTVVIAAPYWDLSFPAVVKTYIENVMVQGLTFCYTPEGMPKGLTNIKKVIYVTTAGGPIGDFNLGFDYVNAVCRGLCSIDNVVCYKAEMLDIIGADVDGILKNAMDQIDEVYGA